jgi:hypothetical protein
VRNLATVWVWVIWWVGFLLFSALVISLWPQIDPFRRLAALLARALGRPWMADAGGVPAVAGLIASAGLLAMAWIELVSDWSEDPRAVGLLMTAYLAVALLGGLAFGQHWFHVADPLTRIFTVLGLLRSGAPRRETRDPDAMCGPGRESGRAEMSVGGLIHSLRSCVSVLRPRCS